MKKTTQLKEEQEMKEMKVLAITDNDREYYQRFYKEHNVVGLLQEENETRIIVKMKQGYKGWTPTGCARDCGNHYIIARYSRHDSVDKKTLNITKDVEDK